MEWISAVTHSSTPAPESFSLLLLFYACSFIPWSDIIWTLSLLLAKKNKQKIKKKKENEKKVDALAYPSVYFERLRIIIVALENTSVGRSVLC